MSEPEQTQEATPDETPDTLPDEHSSGMEAADEMEEAQEEADHEAAQVEGVPVEPEGLSEKQLEAMFGKLDREKKRHDGRVREILGADAEALIDCPLCDLLTPGYVLPMQDTPERFPAVREFMGDAAPEEWKADEPLNSHRCDTCDGYGEVLTGSRTQAQKLLPCLRCNGNGWIGERATKRAVPTFTPPPDANGQSEVTPQGPEPPEAAKLRAMGYTLIQPVGA